MRLKNKQINYQNSFSGYGLGYHKSYCVTIYVKTLDYTKLEN